MEDNNTLHGQNELSKSAVSSMYKDWFLDYASYVIMERAVPKLEDGLKPVQRRILHSMKEMDDGRFNKAANIIGQTMQYHPHGDAAIGDAMVNIGQKELLIDTQGNWGDIRTGDSAAAPRYIEARLSKFALEVAFNAQTSEWQLSYDGRKKEPIALPMKFPLLLAQGADGIAVGLATKILPHNFNELIQASIDVLKGKNTNILPDFPTGGMVDVSEYNEGLRGSKIRVRAKIEIADKKTLILRNIPFGTTTGSVIDSILKANDKGKIKIKKVTDNTAQNVEIIVELVPGTSPDITVDALYAFTDCEVSISPNACVIWEDKPQFLGVNEILRINTQLTKNLLQKELEIKQNELHEAWHFSSLEKIFIEKRIYRDIEDCETWEEVLAAIDKGLSPYKKLFKRPISQDDILKLTEIKIKRISKFDKKKADEHIKNIEGELAEVVHNLSHLNEFAINYFKNLQNKYGKNISRKTEIKIFDTIKAAQVALANQKLYVNKTEGFIGYGLKKDDYIEDCSDIDDVIVIREDGTLIVSKIEEKKFVGKNILYAGVWKKSDERKIFNLIYFEAGSKRTFVKRFNVTSITRDKEYPLTKGVKGSKILYLSANPNGEAETVQVQLTQGCTAKKKVFDFDFSQIEVKGRSALGNILSKYPVKKIIMTSEGISTLSGMNVYFDETIGKLNDENRGKYLGNFQSDDKILVVYKDGNYELTSYEFTNRYEANQIITIEKFNPNHIISCIYFDGLKQHYFVKRFQVETQKANTKYAFISEHKNSQLIVAAIGKDVTVELQIQKSKTAPTEAEQIIIDTFIDIKGWKAQGNRLSLYKIKKIKLLHVAPYDDEADNSSVPATKNETSNQEIQLGTEITWDISSESAQKNKTPNEPKKPTQNKLFED